MYLIHQINLNLINIKKIYLFQSKKNFYLINIYIYKASHKSFALGPKLGWAGLDLSAMNFPFLIG